MEDGVVAVAAALSIEALRFLGSLGLPGAVRGDGRTGAADRDHALRDAVPAGRGLDGGRDGAAAGAGRQSQAGGVHRHLGRPGAPPGQRLAGRCQLHLQPGRQRAHAGGGHPAVGRQQFEVGEPSKPIGAARPDRMVEIPADARAVELRCFITGHGQGNHQNCAEFCPKMHGFAVGGMRFERRIGGPTAPPPRCPTRPATGSPRAPAGARARWSPPGSRTSRPPPRPAAPSRSSIRPSLT